jgi:hypothetical protein
MFQSRIENYRAWLQRTIPALDNQTLIEVSLHPNGMIGSGNKSSGLITIYLPGLTIFRLSYALILEDYERRSGYSIKKLNFKE